MRRQHHRGGRVSLSVRTRFEVFKRDRFTCTYCGGHPPDVLLEVDHVVPRAAGGSDEIDNLVTACWDCNRGKSDRLLDEGDRPTVSPKTVAAMQERLDQARAYVELLNQLTNVTEMMRDRVIEYWARSFDAVAFEEDGQTRYRLAGGTWPNEATLRTFLRELTLEQIFSAIDASAAKIGAYSGNDRYFYAVCWRLIREKRAEPVQAAEDERLLAAQIEVGRLRDELAEANETIGDLRRTIQRFREITGRD
jgi:hypothetical protein